MQIPTFAVGLAFGIAAVAAGCLHARAATVEITIKDFAFQPAEARAWDD